MPAPRRPRTDAADALLTVAPLVSRWIERLLARHTPPLTPSQYLALRAIAREDVGGAELARRTGVSGPAVSQLIAGLAAAGLVSRSARTDDRRRQRLELTETGLAAFASAEALLRERVGGLIAGLPRPEADALARVLPDVAAALSGEAPPRRPGPRPGGGAGPGPGPRGGSGPGGGSGSGPRGGAAGLGRGVGRSLGGDAS
ncbi:MAG TPA: MarR family transcriptional regulator [Solirubrobacteraceae bacterium]|nr:MarR family transcriptional regulator [Solirubrobacteraceae bacterium]